jgi:hypothetical protein
MEASEASKLAKLMNANPFEFPVSGSRIICNTVKTEYTVGMPDNSNSVCDWYIRRKQNEQESS